MKDDDPTPSALLLDRLREPGPLVTVELRPPASDLDGVEGMNAWIDLHHTLRRLTEEDRFVFLTDNAVGAAEEESLAHVGSNVSDGGDLRRIVPILTCKHTLDYCLLFASRAASQGFDAMTVLGGDRDVGPPRCVPHAQDLRARLRERLPLMALGGWVNPHKDPETQLGYLAGPESHADFALTQIVSHHSLDRVEALLEARERLGIPHPLVFGVFFYRSANPDTLAVLDRFFPVPTEPLARELQGGDSPEAVCARTVRRLREVGADKVYLSNLGNRRPHRRLKAVLDRV